MQRWILLCLLCAGLGAGCTNPELGGNRWKCATDEDCLADFECIDGVCSIPGADLCSPAGATRCVGDRVSTCQDDGSGLLTWSVAAACDDGDPCTLQERCRNGGCIYEGTLDCQDTDPCTVDTCVSGQGCVNQPAQDGYPCEDGDPCTVSDQCTGGSCLGPDVNPDCLSCQADPYCEDQFGDGDPCNGNLVCNELVLPSVCEVDPNSVVTCPDPEGCIEYLCDPVDGQCNPVQMADDRPCDDSDPCTDGEFCNAGGCSGGSCGCECCAPEDCPDDGDLCNGIPACQNNGCLTPPESIVVCPPDADGPCATNTCQPGDGQCLMEDHPDGETCIDPGLPCGGGQCQGGVCTPVSAPDDSSCDGVDSDCDGATDEDCPTGPYRLRTVSVSGAGSSSDNDNECYGIAGRPVVTGTASDGNFTLRSLAVPF